MTENRKFAKDDNANADIALLFAVFCLQVRIPQLVPVS